MGKEFGKWLMDVAKYILTAIILSSVFKKFDSIWIYVIAGAAVAIGLGVGLLFVSDKNLFPRKSKND